MKAEKPCNWELAIGDWEAVVSCRFLVLWFPATRNEERGTLMGRLSGEGVKKVRKLKRYKVDQNSADLRFVMANSENSSQQEGPKRRIKGSNSFPCNIFNSLRPRHQVELSTPIDAVLLHNLG